MIEILKDGDQRKQVSKLLSSTKSFLWDACWNEMIKVK